MGKLTASFIAQFRVWDRPAQIAFVVAVVLLVLAGIVVGFGGQNLRTPSVIGFVGLVIATQIIILWANRGMVTTYTQAQRHYLNEDFDAARDLLEALRANGKADFRALTLLGNTYRQMGDLSNSEDVLLEALHNAPNHHFPLYGFGRTLLVEGRYAEAVDALTQALDAGSPPIVLLDIGEALFRKGSPQEAVERLQSVPVTDESYRALMAAYLLHQLGVGDRPSANLIRAGLPYWDATVVRYHHTAYGQALSLDVETMRAYLEEA
jgi:tetratricopeptide (TPR) repeat protein